MSESYELKLINKPIFSNREQGGTSENEVKKDDEYDYDHYLTILKSIYHYFFNHRVISYPYLEDFIDYIRCFNSQLEISWQGIGDSDRCVMEMTSSVVRYPDIIHHVICKIFYLSMGR
ncbi:hypothetical protein RDI58_017595 [Solanum bulbocastanum]|uniref:Uncharacterized protein n=1 Tax=Solanum bulbocastanum TaxID=147425 RepID=A0AAN8TEY4_SOLBU